MQREGLMKGYSIVAAKHTELLDLGFVTIDCLLPHEARLF